MEIMVSRAPEDGSELELMASDASPVGWQRGGDAADRAVTLAVFLRSWKAFRPRQGLHHCHE